MVVQRHLLDVAAAPAVVVDDRHPVAGLQHLLGLHALRPVGVHYHQQRAGLALQERLAAGGQHPRVLRLGLHPPDQRMGCVILRVNDDLALLPPLPGDAAHAHGRAHGVHVRVLVTHDIYLLGVVDQLAQRVGHDPGLHLCPLLRGLAAPAVELEVYPVLHHGLIAAAAEGHLQRQRGVLEQLVKAVLLPAHADGQRGGHTLAGLHLPHLLQHVEFLLGVAAVVLLLEHEQIPVAVIAQQQPAGICRPVVQLLLQRGQHRRALALRAGLHQLLVVVHHEDGHQRPGQLQRLAHLLAVGDVHPVGGGQRVLIPLHLLRMAQRAEYPVNSTVPVEQLRILPLAVQQPAIAEIRHHRVHQHFKDLLLLAGELQKHIVAPQYLAGGGIEHQHGQRRIQHIAGACGVHAAGHPVHVLPHRRLRHLVAAAAHQQHHGGHRRLRQRQQRLKGDGHDDEHHETQAVQRHIGAESANDLLAQKAFLLSVIGIRLQFNIAIDYSTKFPGGQ